MKLEEAKSLAIELMDKHGLFDKGWSFEFDNAKRRLGRCRYNSFGGGGLISLSKHITLINDISIIRNTILHEIAHALVGYIHKHDSVWRFKAMEIGCNGNRLCSDNVKVEGKYVAICNGCGKKKYAHRKKKRASSCGDCSGGSFNSDYILDFKLNIN